MPEIGYNTSASEEYNALPQDNPSPIASVIGRFAALSAIEILNKALGFLATAHLARVLRPENFGVIGFATAILAYFDLFVDGGLSFYGSREASRDPRAAGKLASNILLARLVLAVLAFGGMFLISGFISDSTEARRTLIFYGLTLFTYAAFLDWLCYGLQKTAYLGFASFAMQACFAAGVFALVGNSSEMIRVPLIQTAAEAVSVLILFYFLRIPLRPQFSRSDRGVWSSLWRQAGPIGVGNAMRTVNYSFDIILIGILLNPQLTGSYVAAYRLTLLLITFGALYGQIFLPAITRALKEGGGAGVRILEQSATAGAALILPAAAGCGLLAAGIFQTVFGPGYDAGIAPFRILLAGVVMIVLNASLRQTLIAANQEWAYFKLSAASAATNVILNLVLIPRFQLEGAAVATVISEAVYLVSALIVVRSRIARMAFLRPLLKPLLATALMSAAVYPMRGHFGAAIGTGVVCYLILLPVLGIVRWSDLRDSIQSAGQR